MRAAATFALVLLAACASAPEPAPASKPSYPPSWFAPLPAGVERASWEITPDEAKPGEVILSKRTELGCFSNFAATPFELDGVRFASLEGLWQSLYYPEGPDDPRAALGDWKRTRAEVTQLTGFEAKHAGDEAKKILAKGAAPSMSYRGHRFDPHGSEADRRFHLDLIERATRAKVDQNPAVAALLDRTGDLVLRPDHRPAKDATPAHFYFEILMRIRAERRAK